MSPKSYLIRKHMVCCVDSAVELIYLNAVYGDFPLFKCNQTISAVNYKQSIESFIFFQSLATRSLSVKSVSSCHCKGLVLQPLQNYLSSKYNKFCLHQLWFPKVLRVYPIKELAPIKVLSIWASSCKFLNGMSHHTCWFNKSNDKLDSVFVKA